MNTLLHLTIVLSICCSALQAGIPVSAIKKIDKKPQPLNILKEKPLSKEDMKVDDAQTKKTDQKSQGRQTDLPDPLRIAIVNLAQAIGQLLETKDIEQELTSEDQAKRKELEELATEAKKLQEDLTNGASMLKADAIERKRERIMEIQRTIELRAQNYEQARQRKTQEIQVRIFKDVEIVAEQVRQEREIDIIMAGSVLAYNPKLDITHIIVERMNKTYGAKKNTKKPTAVA